MVDKQSTLREMALFAGAGGGILGGHLLGWKTVCAVEWDTYAACVLAARQNDKILPPFPIWDDVQTFDGKPWRGLVDVVSGGFPCQDISAAGKGAGITGSKSSMWKHMARIIGEVQPRYAFVENSPMLTIRGLGVVLGDLSTLGYDCKWGVVSAASVGAPHKRERIWVRAEQREFPYSSQLQRNGISNNSGKLMGRKQVSESGNNCWEAHLVNTNSTQCTGDECSERVAAKYTNTSFTGWWEAEPDVGRVAHGVAARVDRLKAIGNGQVPAVAATAWSILNGT